MRYFLLLLLFLSAKVLYAAPASQAPMPTPWKMDELRRAPRTYAAPEWKSEGIEGLFYESVPWRGQPTRVFAWFGLPNHKPGQKVPAVVLVHGGGGTAFDYWVKLWNKRGYAAIAMDTSGSLPGEKPLEPAERPRHEFSGPPGWGVFSQIDEPMTDQWTYHAVAAVVLANSLLRSRPEIDANRIGITGVSWGGYLTCIAAGIDDRFVWVAPVYGSGFLADNSVWLPDFERLGKEKAQKWVSLWDPSKYLGRARMPFLWVDGTNDFAYPLDSLQKSYRLPIGPRFLATRLRMAHAHGGPGENPEEIRIFADAICKGGAGLARIVKHSRQGNQLRLQWDAPTKIKGVEVLWTSDNGPWVEREWKTQAVAFDAARSHAEATLPPGATVYFWNITDERDAVSSSEHEELAPQRAAQP
jgi:dienelactone hydrolase